MGDPTNYEDRQQLQDLIEPATSLSFVQKEGEVDVTDDQGRKRIYLTDNRHPAKIQGCELSGIGGALGRSAPRL